MEKPHPIWMRRTALPDAEREESEWVRCPFSKEPVSTETCVQCSRYVSTQPLPEGGSAVVCEVSSGIGLTEPRPLEDADLVRLDGLLQRPLHAVTRRAVFCLDAELELGEAIALLEEEGLTFAPVVDDRGTLIGLADKATLLTAKMTDDARALLLEDVLLPASALEESLSLREALPLLAATRAEGLPVVSQAGVVVGVLLLREVLGWIAGGEPSATSQRLERDPRRRG